MHVWGAIMFAIISGQLLFIIQYLCKVCDRLGLRGPLQEGGPAADAAGPSPSLKPPHSMVSSALEDADD